LIVKPVVLVTTRIADDIVRNIERHASVIQGGAEAKAMTRDEVLARIDDIDAIINQNEVKVDVELLRRGRRLKIVANATAGFDNMQVDAMRTAGVWGTNAPDAYAADTANHTIALMLAVTRRLMEADRYVRSGRWKEDGWMPGGRWDGMSFTGKGLGLIGYGHIAQQVARRAEAFGMNVFHHTRTNKGKPGWLPLDELLAQSDIISLHCPLNDSTRHLINAETLAKTKRGAILINVSRGPVAENTAVIAALKSGQLAGAGLDVFEFEPDVPSELVDLQNVVLSPHMGGCTREARENAFRVCADNVIRVLSGEPPKTPAFAMSS
jgi:glyoxylate reductase